GGAGGGMTPEATTIGGAAPGRGGARHGSTRRWRANEESGGAACLCPPSPCGEGGRGARLSCGRTAATPSPRSKSAVADFDRFIEWPKPAYKRSRLGEGWGGGSGGCGTAVPPLTTPTPNPSPRGGGVEFAAPPWRKLTPMGGEGWGAARLSPPPGRRAAGLPPPGGGAEGLRGTRR